VEIVLVKQKLPFTLLFATYSLLNAQTPAPLEPQSKTGGQVEPSKVYVRRFSLGATLNVQVLPMIKDNSYTQTLTTPVLTTDAATTGRNRRFGYGITGQVAVTEHFAVAFGAIYRAGGYDAVIRYTAGTDNPTTAVDERQITDVQETTSFRYYDFPGLVRYYSPGRHKKGFRWFAEGGGTYRMVNHIKTDRLINDPQGNDSTDNTPAVPNKKNVLGGTVGVGMQFIDPVGLRVVPEVRYTRWFGQTWNALATHSERNQIEAIISFTF